MNTAPDTLAFRSADAMGDLWIELNDAAVVQSPSPMSPPAQDMSLTTAIALSTAFPQHPAMDDGGPDLCLLSRDSVHFYINHSVLSASDNSFGGLLHKYPYSPNDGVPPVIPVSETSALLSLVLHVIHRRLNGNCVPVVCDVLAVTDVLEKYGIPVHPYLTAGQPLFTLLLYYAPLRPLDVYIIAARYDVYNLAAAASAYLHNQSIPDISDSLVLKMGSLYFKRLAELFETRMEVLRSLVLSLPPFHETTLECGYAARGKLVSGWTYAVTELTWDASPGLSSARIRSVFELHEADVDCSDCRARYKSHVKSMLLKWSMAQRTI